ncbi:MAG TPA: PIG-L family deacetylase [Chloroflexota bacterium]
MARRLLLCFAHPDDESFGCGGTIARYVAQGVEVTLVCATRGEAGEIADPALASPDYLGEVRERELREAATVLGIASLHLLGYVDGTLSQVAHEEAVEHLVALLLRTRPHVVVTFGPDGVYGHPDHVAVSRWTTAAFSRARLLVAKGVPDAAPEREEPAPATVAEVPPYAMGGPPDVAAHRDDGALQRLYYQAVPRSRFRTMIEAARRRGVDLAIGGVSDIDRLGVPDDRVTTCLDVRAFVPTKVQAIRRHRTQLPPGNLLDIFDEREIEQFLGVECYIRAYPAAGGARREGDLFEGLS